MARIAVVGGGIAGLAAAHRLVELRDRGLPAGATLEVVVLEASPRPGGKVATERIDGFLVEAGADSFSTRRADALELVEALGLGPEILPTGGGRVLVLQDGRLEELPGGLHLVVPTDLGEIFRSRLLSAPAKARVALELLRPPWSGRGRGPGRAAGGDRTGVSATRADLLRKPAGEPDQATAPFLRRHFGAEYVERVAAPLLAGIHATDAERLSLAAAFPGLAATARRQGSLIRAARHAAGGGPTRVSLAGGVGSLVDALVRRLEAAAVEFATGRRVVGLEPAGRAAGGGFTLSLAGGGSLAADAVILATPERATASLLEPLESLGSRAAATLRAIPATSTATVSLGFRREDVRHPLDALGLLAPTREGRSLGACTFASTKFPGRAPAGAVLVRAYLGAGSGELPRDDDAVTGQAFAELEGVLGLSCPPLLARVHRFPHGNPQYLVGHRERITALEAALPPGLALAGCAYHGLGIPDCIASGHRAAERASELTTVRRARTA